MSIATHDLPYEVLVRARATDLVRLARFLGIDVECMAMLPDARHRIAVCICRFLKRNPQRKRARAAKGEKKTR